MEASSACLHEQIKLPYLQRRFVSTHWWELKLGLGGRRKKVPKSYIYAYAKFGSWTGSSHRRTVEGVQRYSIRRLKPKALAAALRHMLSQLDFYISFGGGGRRASSMLAAALPTRRGATLPPPIVRRGRFWFISWLDPRTNGIPPCLTLWVP